MWILALDTTTRGGSVAVADGDRLVAFKEGDPARTHGERLPGEIADVLAQAGIACGRIDLLTVASGPGAFTGLRIGLATVQGLAMVLGRPVVGVPTLDALAWAALEPGERGRIADPIVLGELIIPWMDAQRGDVYAAIYEAARPAAAAAAAWLVIEPAVVAAPQELLASWQPRLGGRRAVFVGDAVGRDRAQLEARGDRWRLLPPPPLAPAVARLGRRLADAGRAGPPHALMPIYVRRPDAELARERRDARHEDA